MNKEFVKYISTKLKTGNLRSIHLNALPSRYATRLDICNLDYLNKDPDSLRLSEDFLLNNLLSKPTFKFQINLQKYLKDSAEEIRNKAMLLDYNFNAVYNQNEDGYLEHGVKTFSFGFPVLIKRSKKHKDKIIKAPLFIWSLEIERSLSKSNHWSINRVEDSPIYINEVLLSHIAQDEAILIQALEQNVLDDDLFSSDELLEVIQSIMKQLGVEQGNEKITVKPSLSASQIEDKTDQNAWILWSGIFGLYKTQKQPIIKDVDYILQNIEDFDFSNTEFSYNKRTNNCSVETDPSQEAILDSLGSTEYKIIQGPPGTGKSQSLTAVISNALENDQKILVVCEKRTALTVVYENLKAAGLGHLAVVIDDINKDRRAIVNLARERVGNIGANGSDFNEIEYDLALEKRGKAVEEVKQKHANLTAPFFNGKNLKQILADYLNLALEYDVDDNIFKDIKLEISEEEFNKIEGAVELSGDVYQEVNTKRFDVLKATVFQEDISPNTHERVVSILEKERDFFSNITKDAFFVSESVGNLKSIPKDWTSSIEYYGFRMYMLQVEETTSFWKKMRDETAKVDQHIKQETSLVEHTFFQQIEAVQSFQIKIDRFLTDLENVLRCLHKMDEAAKKVYLHLGNFTLSYKKRSFLYKLFSKKRTAIYDFWETTLVNVEEVNRLFDKNDLLKKNASLLEKYLEIGDFVKNLEEVEQNISECLADKKALPSYYKWRNLLEGKDQLTSECLLALSEEENVEDWKPMFELYYLDLLIAKRQNKKGLFNNNDRIINRVKTQTEKLRNVQRDKIVKNWETKQKSSVDNFNKENNINWLFNHRKNTQYDKRNSLRKILHDEFELVTNLFPVLLVNPVVCSSILPLKKDLFDIVLFDEASQLRVEDTFAAMIRGRIKIISGDKHQMPPSNYFATDVSLDVASEKEALSNETYKEQHPLFLAQSESLLDFGNRLNPNLTEMAHLDFHYRSRHPYLIDFSNAAFYGNRLIPMPSKESYKPIRCFQINGIYYKGKNELEAQKIVNFIRHEYPVLEDGSYPSLGIATFNVLQRDLILAKLNEMSLMDEEFRKKLYAIDEKGKWFVKNLENIQGDERDVIIISTTFGLSHKGNFRQNFGKISWALGYRLLNVIITRAKHNLFVFTSIPETFSAHKYESEIATKGNTGKALLYAYIDYCKAIEHDDEEKRQRILNLLTKASQGRSLDLNQEKQMSSFEEVLFEYLTEYIHSDRIKTAYRLGGFTVDFVLLDEEEKPIIAIECDGAAHHNSPQACSHDIYRQKVLENLGLKYYKIWSSAWWPDPHAEIQKLLDFIEEIDTSVFNWVK